MSEYPKLSDGPGWECQGCNRVWERRDEAAECCPPLPTGQVWLCGGKQCESGAHRSREQAEICSGIPWGMRECVCGHPQRWHGLAREHPGCYSPGCKCMAPELPE